MRPSIAFFQLYLLLTTLAEFLHFHSHLLELTHQPCLPFSKRRTVWKNAFKNFSVKCQSIKYQEQSTRTLNMRIESFLRVSQTFSEGLFSRTSVYSCSLLLEGPWKRLYIMIHWTEISRIFQEHSN